MSVNDPGVRLRHMLQIALDVRRGVDEYGVEEFNTNVIHQWGIVHGLLMIGEAAAHVEESERAQFPEIPWKRVVGFRHLAVHEYFRIETDEVWKIASESIQELIRMLEEGGVVAEEGDDE